MAGAALSHPLLWYYAAALVIATGGVAVAARVDGGREITTIFPAFWAWLKEQRTYVHLGSILRFTRVRPWMWIVPLYAAAPSIAAVVVASASSGNAGLDHLVGRLAPWDDGLATSALVTYAVILVTFLAVAVWFLHVDTVQRATGWTPTATGLVEGRNRAAILGRMTVGLLLDEGGTLEELGWRGFMVPLLLASTGNRLGTSLLVGVLWWAWHLPREVPALLRPNWRKLGHDQGIFLLLCAATAITLTEVVVRTGSVWPAVMVHATGNVWNKAIGEAVHVRYRTDVRTWIHVGIAAVVAVSWLLA